MPEPRETRDSSSRVQITVALIGLLGVIATALISNWNHIFPRNAPAPTPSVAPVTTSGSAPAKRIERVPQETEPPEEGSEHRVHSNGHMVIRATYLYDLDRGEEQDADADFWWEHETMKTWFLTPENGAAFYVVGPVKFEAVKWSDMERFPYSTAKINATEGPSNRIPAGTVVAYRTHEGRLGKLIVDDYGSNLSIRWRTYD
jgi:hypothetical protein